MFQPSGSADTIAFSTAGTETMRITNLGGISFGSSGTGYGASGQVLTSNGNASPSWQAAGGGLPTKTVVNIAGSGQASIALGVTPSSTAYVDLYVDGVYQNKNTYAVSGVNLTLTSPAIFPTGVSIEAVTTT